jgi:D-alanyl-D-alanine endopeptidase (penicillin-binding protein 7)
MLLLKNALKILVVLSLSIGPVYAKKHHSTAKRVPIPTKSSPILATSYMVQDIDTGEIIAEKNSSEVRSIASITKLMTAMVVVEAGQSMDEIIDVKPVSGIRSRMQNSKRTRAELLTLALMSSDNLAAKVLAINYPGGEVAALIAMNAKAQQLSMKSTYFADPTGLFENNVSTVQDLVKLTRAAEQYPFLRFASTNPRLMVEIPHKKKSTYLEFHTTNRLIHSIPEIVISKTGWIQNSGGCLLMSIHDRGRRLAVILLNSKNTHTRFRDGELLYGLEHGKSI